VSLLLVIFDCKNRRWDIKSGFCDTLLLLPPLLLPLTRHRGDVDWIVKEDAVLVVAR